MLSRRVAKSKGSPNLLHAAWYKQHTNPYDVTDNPEGIINLGTAENRVIEDAVMKKLATINMGDIPEEYTHYCKLSGTDQFRDKLSVFLDQHLEPLEKISREDVFVMNGCGTVIEALGYSICDEGDGVLIPTPYYCGFKSDLEQRVGVKVVPVHLSGNTDSKKQKEFQLTTDDLEKAFLKAENDGVPVKALLLSNPNNPLGNMYTEEELTSYINFCRSYNIHLICDEIYMLSVYDEDIEFKSVLSLECASSFKDNIHVVWGFSKDFGLSGFRCGVAITKNTDLQSALTSVGYYTSVPTATQYVLEQFITDDSWVEQLVSLNHERLRSSRDLVTSRLSTIGVPHVYPTSGLFIWVNLSQFLSSSTKQAEIDLFNFLMDNGLYLVPGFAFECREHGWFRIIISHGANILTVSMDRLKVALMQCTSDKQSTKEKMQIGCKRISTDKVHVLETYVNGRKSSSKMMKISREL